MQRINLVERSVLFQLMDRKDKGGSGERAYMSVKRKVLILITILCCHSLFAKECGLMPCVGTSVKKLKEMHYRRIITVAELEGFKEGLSSKEIKDNFGFRSFRTKKNIDGFNVEIFVDHDLEKACSQSIYIDGVKRWNKDKIESVLKKITGLKFKLPTKEFNNHFKKSPQLDKEQEANYSPLDFLYYERDSGRIGLHFRQSSICKPIPPGRL